MNLKTVHYLSGLNGAVKKLHPLRTPPTEGDILEFCKTYKLTKAIVETEYELEHETVSITTQIRKQMERISACGGKISPNRTFIILSRKALSCLGLEERTPIMLGDMLIFDGLRIQVLDKMLGIFVLVTDIQDENCLYGGL